MPNSPLSDGQEQKVDVKASPTSLPSAHPQGVDNSASSKHVKQRQGSRASKTKGSAIWGPFNGQVANSSLIASSAAPFVANEGLLGDFVPGSIHFSEQEGAVMEGLWHHDELFMPLPLNKTAQMDFTLSNQAAAPQPVVKPRRKLTPSEEQLSKNLEKLGIKENSKEVSPGQGGFEKGSFGGWANLQLVQQEFEKGRLKKDLLEGSVPDLDPEPALSPVSSNGSTLTGCSSPPQKGHVGAGLNGVYQPLSLPRNGTISNMHAAKTPNATQHQHKISGDLDRHSQKSPPVPSQAGRSKTQWHLDAPEFYPNAYRHNQASNIELEHRNSQWNGLINQQVAGQIDPYIPQQCEKSVAYENTSLQRVPGNAQGFNGHYQPLTASYEAVALHTAARHNVSEMVSRHQNGLSEWKPTIANSVTQSNANGHELMHGLLRSSPNIDDFVEMKRRESVLKRSLAETRSRLDFSLKTAMGHINSRDAEIGHLKRFIRSLGAKVPTDITGSDDAFFEKELGMMFRTVCCWAKRFYKFPTDTPVPHRLQETISEICEDSESERRLMNSEQTKYLVVISLAARFFRVKIFGGEFLDHVGKTLECEDVLHLVEAAKRDNSLDDKLYQTVQQVARHRASMFLEYIHPLMSRPTDRNHFDQTRKQFISVTQQAARMAVEISRRYDWHIHFKFFHLGDSFKSSQMVAVSGNTLGLDMTTGSEQVLYELQGSGIRLCILPFIHWTKTSMDGCNSTHTTTLFKSNVLLL